MLDEPLSNLDVGLREGLLDMFQELFGETETASLYVTHDPWEAERIASRVVIIEEGRAVFSGGLRDLQADQPSEFARNIHRAMGSKSEKSETE